MRDELKGLSEKPFVGIVHHCPRNVEAISGIIQKAFRRVGNAHLLLQM
jgi:hypothetical protein